MFDPIFSQAEVLARRGSHRHGSSRQGRYLYRSACSREARARRSYVAAILVGTPPTRSSVPCHSVRVSNESRSYCLLRRAPILRARQGGYQFCFEEFCRDDLSREPPRGFFPAPGSENFLRRIPQMAARQSQISQTFLRLWPCVPRALVPQMI